MKLPFVGQAYTARSLNVDAQRCVNLYPEVDQTGKEVIALYGTPGLDLLATIGNGPIRGVRRSGSYIYVVSGAEVYRVGTDWIGVLIGTLTTSSGPVSMQANRTRMVLVDGTLGYTILLSTGVMTQITDADFPADPVVCGQLDIYFIVVVAGSDSFYYSEDGVNWDALDFASAEGAPDSLVSVLCDHREIWLFGEVTSEVWANSGDADNTIQRIQGAYSEIGCVSPFGCTKADNSVFWVGRDETGQGIAYRAQGYTPQRISTHAIETEWQGYSDISDCIAWAEQEEGHTFIWFTFPTVGKTWVFDVATMMWHERAYRDPNTGTLGRHRANCHEFFNGKHVVGDYETGELYALDPDVYDDDGDEIKALRSCRHLDDQDELNRVRHSRLQIDLEAGVGISSGQGSDPQAMLRWSDDGGHSWSNEHWTDIGAIGNYRTRAIWRRLASSRDRVYEVSITDPVKRVIIGANLRAS